MKKLIEKYLYIPVEGETINTDRECPEDYPYIQIHNEDVDKDRQASSYEHVALLDTGQLVYMDSRGATQLSRLNISLGKGIYHHTVVRK